MNPTSKPATKTLNPRPYYQTIVGVMSEHAQAELPLPLLHHRTVEVAEQVRGCVALSWTMRWVWGMVCICPLLGR